MRLRLIFNLLFKLISWQGIDYDDNYESATRGCTEDKCVEHETKYKNGYFTRYDIITRGFDNYIPGLNLAKAIETYFVKQEYWNRVIVSLFVV